LPSISTQHQHEPERHLDAVHVPFRERGRDRGYARGDTDGDRQHVIDEQRGRRDERGRFAQIVLRHDVGAAAARIRMDRLPVRKHDDRENRGDDQGDWRGERQRAGADENQNAENLLGSVRDRRQRVRRQHCEAGKARQAFVMGEVRRDRLTNDEPLGLREQAFGGHASVISQEPARRP
jgi:hypothetical protein